MSAHDSLLPGETKSKVIRVDSTGGSLSWKGWGYFVGSLLTVIIGSGSFVGFQFATKADLKASEVVQEKKITEVKTSVKKEISSINTKIGNLDNKVGKVQKYQIKQDARQEARRITENIRDRTKREEQYDRLRELNEKRLEKGNEPCATLECSN